jgi:hypothetical protein
MQRSESIIWRFKENEDDEDMAAAGFILLTSKIYLKNVLFR